MAGSEVPDHGDLAWWDARYLSGDTPWDTGVVPPEIVTLVESSSVSRGWALDLGCGTGVTSCYLAARGFRVVCVDLAQVALRRGLERASTNGLSCFFVRADATQLSFVHIQASLAVDIGCFHNLSPSGRASYIRSLAEHLQRDSYYLLYAFFFSDAMERTCDPSTTPMVGPADIAAFAPEFILLKAEHGQDRERSSAWFLMRRACRDAATVP